MSNTNENKCLLATVCKVAGNEAHCHNACGHWIGLHGASGGGGRVAAANVPADYARVTLKNSPARTSQSKVYKIIDQYVSTFSRQFEGDSEPIKSLYLVSEAPGTGKTTTASAVLNSWLITHYIGSLQRNRQALQRPCYFLDVNEFQTVFNEFNRSNVPREVAEPAASDYYKRMKLAKETPFVVMDDIGVRSASEAFRGDLHSVINHRVTNKLPTVFTSNIELAELQDVFDARLYDRVRDQCFELQFDGESNRGVRR